MSQVDKKAAASEVIVRGHVEGFAQEIEAGPHFLHADEPLSAGGNDSGPSPYDLLAAALGACTSMTIGVYARRKQWPVRNITVRLRHSKVHAADCVHCEAKDGYLDRIDCEIELEGALSDEQRARLLEIANKCPVHKTLKSEIDIETRLV